MNDDLHLRMIASDLLTGACSPEEQRAHAEALDGIAVRVARIRRFCDEVVANEQDKATAAESAAERRERGVVVRLVADSSWPRPFAMPDGAA